MPMYASAAQIKAMSPIHILRGLQIAWLGVLRAIQNPNFYTAQHAKLLLSAAFVGISLHFLVRLPSLLLHASFSILENLHYQPTWKKDFIYVLEFVQHWVVQVPFMLLNIYKSYYPEPFDDLFMNSMSWVDHIYSVKHQEQPQTQLRSLYVPTLSIYKPLYKNTLPQQMVKRAAFSLILYIASFVPRFGGLVLPSISFYTLNKTIGLIPASVVSIIALVVLPREYSIVLLQLYLSTRSLTRQLLTPYFARVGSSFSAYQKAKWYREREGVLFGFTLPFLLLMRLPYLGVLSYGFASSGAAFLLSKVTHPPPENSEELDAYAEEEQFWTEGRRNLVKAGLAKAHLSRTQFAKEA